MKYAVINQGGTFNLAKFEYLYQADIFAYAMSMEPQHKGTTYQVWRDEGKQGIMQGYFLNGRAYDANGVSKRSN